ncbi:MAG: carbonic anhydrase [Candidatus Poseidoniales archaeon]
MSPDEAFEQLMNGHQRFLTGRQQSNFNLETATSNTQVQGQNPLASVLTCSDSRAIPAFIFDMSFGDIFVVKTAGAIATETQIASLEFAVAQLNCPLIVVMGHTMCGAIGATMQHLEGHSPTSPNLLHLVEHISHLIEEQADDTTKAVQSSTIQTAKRLTNHSDIIARAVANGEVKIVSCIYDLTTGQLNFLE